MAKLEPAVGQLRVGVRAENGTCFTRAPFRGGFAKLPRRAILPAGFGLCVWREPLPAQVRTCTDSWQGGLWLGWWVGVLVAKGSDWGGGGGLE